MAAEASGLGLGALRGVEFSLTLTDGLASTYVWKTLSKMELVPQCVHLMSYNFIFAGDS